ncbi:putative feruloyl esterase [Medicago truncatula]|uniref:Putative feruloyl esterase n=1 Tax=Medicago truncatula TaxID=3880 RepID=A0A396JAB2_MEDTR|nr:putative feruloyl esterase [Medicago truncatula]
MIPLSFVFSAVEHHQRIIILNKNGEKLVGILHETGTTNDIVILCHGVQCSKDTELIVNLAVALEKAQISSFRFDFSGCGESKGTYTRDNFWEEVDDLRAVAQHFRESNRVIRAIVGHSKGGDIVLLYASKYHDVKTVVNVSGRFDLNRHIGEGLGIDYLERNRKEGFLDKKKSSECFDYCVTEKSLMDCLGTNMHDECLKIDKYCRVLTVHGSCDELNPIQDAYEFNKIIPNHKLHIIERANHMYDNHQDELTSVVISFIKETIDHNKLMKVVMFSSCIVLFFFCFLFLFVCFRDWRV